MTLFNQSHVAISSHDQTQKYWRLSTNPRCLRGQQTRVKTAGATQGFATVVVVGGGGDTLKAQHWIVWRSATLYTYVG